MNFHTCTVRYDSYCVRPFQGHSRSHERWPFLITCFKSIFRLIFRDQKEYECELGVTILVRGRGFLFDIQKYFFLLSVRSILLALVSVMMDYSRIIRFDFLKNNPLIRNMIDLLWKVQLVFRYSFDPVTDWFWIVLESNIYAVDYRGVWQRTSNKR